MRRMSLIFIMMICALALALSACSGSASLSGILQQKGISDKTADTMKVEIRFLQESKGSNYKFADLSGDKALINQMIGILQASKPVSAPAGQYTPELKSDYEMVFADSTGKTVSVYYAVKDNYLIYPDRKTDKSGETLEYRYFTPDAKLSGLIAGQKQNSALKQSNDVKPFRSMEELKSSIDPDELAEEGTALDFEFFSDATPENTGTACRIYTGAEFPSIPQGSYLVTAYGKSKTGQQEKLSITSIKANTNYTIISVELPDDSLDSVDTGADVPQSYAATVKISAIDPAKWIVFVDGDNNILDVILPEDIAAIPSPAQPSVSAAPSGATAAPTEEPPEGGGSTDNPDDGPGDES